MKVNLADYTVDSVVVALVSFTIFMAAAAGVIIWALLT